MEPRSEPRPDAAPAELTRQQKALTLLGTGLALFLAALDQTIVATAGPDIMHSLGIAPAMYTWLTTSYLVAATVMVPVFGRLSDLYGRKVIIVAGVVIFLTASVLCGLSRSGAELIAWRGLQGVGSASLFTTTFAVVADLFPPAERGRYSGLLGSVFGVASLVGPLLGGFITDHFGWHWVFLINLPVGAVALGFILLRMPRLRRPTGQRPLVDVVGAVLLAVGVVPLLLGATLGRPLLRPGDDGYLWTSWQILALFAVSAVGCVAFVAWELRARQPLVDLRLFGRKTVAWGIATAFVMGAVFLTPTVFLPLFMVHVVGVTATGSGLTMSPLVLGTVAGNILSGQLVSRFGRYKPLMLGSHLLLVVAFVVAGFTLRADSTQAEVTLKMVLLGLGLGPALPLYTLAIQNAVPPEQVGVATSMTTFFRQLGATIGVAVAGSLFATTLNSQLDAHLAEVTAGLPPQLVERFSPQGLGPADAERGAGARFDAAKVKERVHGQLDGARTVAKKALQGDALAGRLVEMSPLADERLKALAAQGGVRAQAKRRIDLLSSRIEGAAGNPAAWQALLASGQLSPEVAAQLRAIPPEAMLDPASRAGALAGVRQTLDREAQVAGERALQDALASVDRTFEAQLPRVDAAIDRVGGAIRSAFTGAIAAVFRVALLLTVLGLLLTLMVPQLPLRTTHASEHESLPPGRQGS